MEAKMLQDGGKTIRMLKYTPERLLEFAGAEASPGYYSLYITKSGGRVVMVDGKKHTLRSGCVLLASPENVCSSSGIDGFEGECWLLQVPKVPFEMLLSQTGVADWSRLSNGGSHYFVMPDGFDPAFDRILLGLNEELQTQDEGSYAFVASSLTLLLLRLLRLPEETVAEEGMRRGKGPLDMHEIAAFIDKHYGERLTMTILCKIFSISLSTMSRAFKREIGMPPVSYLNQVRVEAARKLIDEDPRLPLTEVCSRVGYDNLTYFGRVFKNSMGITPGAYRSRKRQKV